MRAHTRGVVGIAVCSLVLGLTPLPRALAGGDELTPYLRAAEDTSASIADREKALGQAKNYAYSNKGGSDPLKATIEKVLKEFEKKKADATCGAFVEYAFQAMDPFEPFPNVGGLSRAYLSKDTDPKMRLAALTAIARHGANQISSEMIALFDEPTQIKDRTRENLENIALNATLALPGGEAQKVLEAIMKNSKSRVVRLKAFDSMGQLVDLKPPSELDEKIVKPMLMSYAVVSNTDEEVGCKAALALTHWGTWDGIAEVMKRCQAGRHGPSQKCYETVCSAAHKVGGFAGVSPSKYNQATPAQRSDATGEMLNWWDKASKTARPDTTLFEALAETGTIKLPKDTSINSKDAISTLISGLEVPNRSLRYACLDMLVKRTGNTELAKGWRTWVVKSTGTSMSKEEPEAGFPEGSPQADQLYELQKERAKKWRAWWDANSGKASLVGGVWKVS